MTSVIVAGCCIAKQGFGTCRVTSAMECCEGLRPPFAVTMHGTVLFGILGLVLTKLQSVLQISCSKKFSYAFDTLSTAAKGERF
jgi:hypothetical protein